MQNVINYILKRIELLETDYKCYKLINHNTAAQLKDRIKELKRINKMIFEESKKQTSLF